MDGHRDAGGGWWGREGGQAAERWALRHHPRAVVWPLERSRSAALCALPSLAPAAAPQIAIEMLESGKVDAVVCVQSDESDRFSPKPVRRGRACMAGPVQRLPPCGPQPSSRPPASHTRLCPAASRCAAPAVPAVSAVPVGGGPQQGRHPGGARRQAHAVPQPQRAGHGGRGRGGAGRGCLAGLIGWLAPCRGSVHAARRFACSFSHLFWGLYRHRFAPSIGANVRTLCTGGGAGREAPAVHRCGMPGGGSGRVAWAAGLGAASLRAPASPAVRATRTARVPPPNPPPHPRRCKRCAASSSTLAWRSCTC